MSLLKTLSERGPAAAALQRGHEHFFRGRYTLALLAYLRAADIGVELGQSNVAWMLDRGYGPGECGRGPTLRHLAQRCPGQMRASRAWHCKRRQCC